MSKRPQFANYGEHQIPFNDSLGDLDYFRVVEDKWSFAFEQNNLRELYHATMLYFIALKTRSKFEQGDEIYKKLKDLEIKIYSIDSNRDGKISPMEMERSAQLFGYCRENLIKIYMQLAEIKVDSGWTLKKQEDKRPVTPAMEKLINDYLPRSKELLSRLIVSSPNISPNESTPSPS